MYFYSDKKGHKFFFRKEWPSSKEANKHRIKNSFNVHIDRELQLSDNKLLYFLLDI